MTNYSTDTQPQLSKLDRSKHPFKHYISLANHDPVTNIHSIHSNNTQQHQLDSDQSLNTTYKSLFSDSLSMINTDFNMQTDSSPNFKTMIKFTKLC